MSSASLNSVSFHWNPRYFDSLPKTVSRKLLWDLILLSKYLWSSCFLEVARSCESIPGTVGKPLMFGGGSIPGGGLVQGCGVKVSCTYRVTQYHEEGTLLQGSLTPSRRVSNLTILDPLSHQSIYENKDHQDGDDDKPHRITSNEGLGDMTHSSSTYTTRVRDGERPRKPSTNDLGTLDTQSPRSQSIGPSTNTIIRATLSSPSSHIKGPDPDIPDPVSEGPQTNSRACYFCWCCVCSCSCDNMKTKPKPPIRTHISHEPQSKLHTVIADERLSLEDAQKWAQNFEFLMQSTAGRKIFQEFLKSEYSEENIMFYKAVEDLQTETNDGLVEEKARSIYEDYISILSPKEVSLDSRVRDLINSDMAEPSCHTFDEAQLQIFTLMQRDSYPRFLNSRFFKDLFRHLDGTSTTSNSQTLAQVRPLTNS